MSFLRIAQYGVAALILVRAFLFIASPTSISLLLSGFQMNDETFVADSDFAIVTAFSENHMYENLSMLRSLIRVNYTGPVAVYFIWRKYEVERNPELARKIAEQLAISPLNATLVEFEVIEEIGTYCFKPQVMQHFLSRPHNRHTKILMWTDSAPRFRENPQKWAKNMWEDGVDFVGRTDSMGMGENTDPDTYHYLGLSRRDFKEYHEIHAQIFLINLARRAVRNRIFRKWVDCGTRACTTCMSPPDSSKELSGPELGPPSTIYIAHRQDQSVLSLLVYDYKRKESAANIQLDKRNYRYLNMRSRRRPDVNFTSVEDLNSNSFEPIPPA